MSGLFDQITNYSPPLLTAGQVNYKGTWSAAANSPTLVSPPASTSKGDYYVVSAAGTQFGITFAVGDWIISNGTAWEKVDLTDAVSSVFGRTGAVVGVSTDYSAVGITNTAIGASSPSTGAFTTITATSTITATGAVTGSNLSGTNTGNQTISITGDVTAAGSTGVLTASVTKINGTSLAGLTTGILKNTTTTGVPSIAVAADFPTLNQNTTGSAATLTTSRSIHGGSFNGSADVTNVITGTYGGTGVNNGANTITIAGNVTHAGAFTQSFTATANTALTLPVTGTLATLAGSEALSNKTITASPISGSTGAFTTLSATGNSALSGLTVNGAPSTLSGSGFEIAGGALPYILSYNRTGSAFLNMDLRALTVTIKPSDSTVGVFSSTGLALTGALSSTTNISVTNGGSSVAGSMWANSSSGLIHQAKTGSTYDYQLINPSASLAILSVNAGTVNLLTGGNLAVTGALSSTTGATFATSSGNVGIGTSSPSGKLHTVSTAGFIAPNLLCTDTVSNFRILFQSSLYAGVPANKPWLHSYDDIYIGSDGTTSFNVMSGGVNTFKVTSAGNVGIGTASPDRALYVVGGGRFTSDLTCNLRLFVNSPSYEYALRTNTSSSSFEIVDWNTTLTRIAISTAGAVRFNAYGAGALTTDASGNITASSDERIKSNIRPFSRGLAEILAINPILHGYTEESGLDQSRDDYAGFSAQQVQPLIPEAIGENANGMLSFSDRPVMAALVNAMKELNANLVAELQSLRQRVAALESN